ncbi:MAG TPA: crotonase/enoyl-CoA hydratase family protein [Verrucomicrobiae bacterium]|nr:crotonase/enoyl-CoA hydratase family protein [Verrucomicrobiae bacterium]
MSERVRIEMRGAVAQVTLTRADKHNGMDLDMLEAVRGAAKRLKKNRAVRAVILAGDGPSFCAGLDVKAVFGSKKAAAMGFAALWSPVRNRFQDWSMAWREVPAPVIACVHGNCFGAGIQLSLGADIRIATPDAKLSVMEAKWGLIPDMGGAALLRELVPIDVAKELAMTGRVLNGVEAHALGLVSHVSENPLAHAETLAAELQTRSPDAVAAAKFLLQTAFGGGEATALAAERRWQRRLLGSRNQRIAVARNLERKDLPYGPRRIGA